MSGALALYILISALVEMRGVEGVDLNSLVLDEGW